MKRVINRKQYDTSRCTLVGERDSYSTGNYAGTDYLYIAEDGKLLVHSTSNDQDLYRTSGLFTLAETGLSVDDFAMDAEQEKWAIYYNVIEKV